MRPIYELETYFVIGDDSINCFVSFTHINADSDIFVGRCIIEKIVTDNGEFDLYDLNDFELNRLEYICMERYLKLNERDYGE